LLTSTVCPYYCKETKDSKAEDKESNEANGECGKLECSVTVQIYLYSMYTEKCSGRIPSQTGFSVFYSIFVYHTHNKNNQDKLPVKNNAIKNNRKITNGEAKKIWLEAGQ
jgi:hypothetical protein